MLALRLRLRFQLSDIKVKVIEALGEIRAIQLARNLRAVLLVQRHRIRAEAVSHGAEECALRRCFLRRYVRGAACSHELRLHVLKYAVSRLLSGAGLFHFRNQLLVLAGHDVIDGSVPLLRFLAGHAAFIHAHILAEASMVLRRNVRHIGSQRHRYIAACSHSGRQLLRVELIQREGVDVL